MSYEKHTWSAGETITAEKLNNIEDGVDSTIKDAVGAGAIILTEYNISSGTHAVGAIGYAYFNDLTQRYELITSKNYEDTHTLISAGVANSEFYGMWVIPPKSTGIVLVIFAWASAWGACTINTSGDISSEQINIYYPGSSGGLYYGYIITGIGNMEITYP